jgi:citrate lyase subunit beta/citryl-CoA lyase
MNRVTAVVGNSGPKIRSDCEMTLELKQKGGISIDLDSKVKALYGESILKQCNEILRFFGVKNAGLSVNDSGALPFVISARLEAAVRRLIETDLEYLPEMLSGNKYSTTRDRFRFSRLYLPGNNPGMMINAGLHSADGIILDLEDSVAPDRKYEARILVRNALCQVDFRGAERMVRINHGETGLSDLRAVIPRNVNLVLIPKCDSPENVIIVDKEISAIRKRLKIRNPVYLMPIIESASGVENSSAIARASENIVAMAIGLEDLTADMGIMRSREGKESFYSRSRLVIAAKAAGIQPIDSVYSDVADMEGLRQNVLDSRAMGFEGMGCIHPRQIAIINEGFAPGEAELEKSMKIVMAYKEAGKKGLGVVALGPKMIDLPVVARAQKMIDLAIKLGRISPDWREKFK